MGERRSDGDESGGPPPDDSRGPSPDDSGDPPLERGPGRDKMPDRGHILIKVIQLLTALAAAAHEFSRLLG